MLFHFKRKRITAMINDDLLLAIDEVEKDIESRSAVLSGEVAEDQKYLDLRAMLNTLKHEFVYRQSLKR